MCFVAHACVVVDLQVLFKWETLGAIGGDLIGVWFSVMHSKLKGVWR